jgi:solute carrier family 25 (mitochondrial S-adenosylmethionine transporter), member 26
VSAVEVVRRLLAAHGGALSPGLVATLFSGFGAAAGFSVLVGAVHWLSFCAAKRGALDAMPAIRSATATAPAAASASEATSGVPVAPAAPPPVAAVVACEHGPLMANNALIQPGQGGADVDVGGVGPGQVRGVGVGVGEGDHTSAANAFAAVFGALCTALVESPIELFRHQAQVRRAWRVAEGG